MPDLLDEISAGEDTGEGTTTPEPAPVPEPVPDPEPAPAPHEEEPSRRVGMVPHGALHAAREENKQLKQRLQEMEQRPQLTQEDIQLLRQLRAQPKASEPAVAPKPAEPEPKIPDFMEDPKGYVDAMNAQNAKQLKELRELGTKMDERHQVFSQQQQMAQIVQSSEGEFIKTAPDYYKSTEFIGTSRFNVLKVVFPQATDMQIRNTIAQEMQQLAQMAIQSGRSPAELAYNYAKSLGYQPPTAVKPGEDPKIAAAKAAAGTLGASSGPAREDPAEDDAAKDDPNSEIRGILAEKFGIKKK